jgi:SAM-dependent methyltransferase
MFELTATPPANAFVPAEDVDTPQEVFPLDVYRCSNCGHLQLLEIVDPEAMFRHYVYVSSTSPVMVDHLKRYAETVTVQAHLAPGDLVVEFGSNDGTLLRFFKDQGMRVFGVDPARNIAEEATRNGIETIANFFTPDLAMEIRAKYGTAKVICANNVCAHIDNLASVFDGVRALLADGGRFVFEVGYLYDVIANTYFDTIYHEHVDFHRVGPLRRFCKTRGLELIAAERVDIQGGSIRCIAQLSGGPAKIEDSVERLIALEEQSGLDKPETFKAFAERINQRRVELTALLRGLKQSGKNIGAFGAPAKATTLMYHFGLSTDIVDYIVDDNPLKQGLYSPGLHVPVVHPRTLRDQRPDYLVILAWNFAASVMSRNRAYSEQGGRFIVPLPNLSLH